MKPVVIYGAGGLGGLVQDILQQSAQFQPVAFLDSAVEKHGKGVSGLPVLGGVAALLSAGPAKYPFVIVAIGDNVTRVALAETLQAHGFQLASAIHPLASISPAATLAEHLVIGPRATLCVHAQVGPHCIISAGAIADHDNVLGRGVFLHPAVRLAGGVSVGDFAVVGIGAVVIPGRKLGCGALVEPGAVVIRDVPRRAVVGGVPANPLRDCDSQFIPGAGGV